LQIIFQHQPDWMQVRFPVRPAGPVLITLIWME
jgi:hypothetical protein